MSVVYVIQYSTHDHPFIDLVYAVTDNLEDAIIMSDGLRAEDEVMDAGYEEVVFYSSDELVME